jgi:hypothetical protein
MPSCTGNFKTWICSILRWRTAHSIHPKRNCHFQWLDNQVATANTSRYQAQMTRILSTSLPKNENNPVHEFCSEYDIMDKVQKPCNPKCNIQLTEPIRLELNISPSCALELKQICYNAFLWNTLQCKNVSVKLVKMVSQPTAKVGHSQIYAKHVTIWGNLKKN